MCIRDSIKVLVIDDDPIIREFLETTLKNLHVQAIRSCADAVSYTHLRAHETVLDLVCRLLLEKKQQQAKKHT